MAWPGHRPDAIVFEPGSCVPLLEEAGGDSMVRNLSAIYYFGMRGDEKRVVDAFVAWLQQDGWIANTEVNFVDVCARRGTSTCTPRPKGGRRPLALTSTRFTVSCCAG